MPFPANRDLPRMVRYAPTKSTFESTSNRIHVLALGRLTVNDNAMPFPLLKTAEWMTCRSTTLDCCTFRQ